MTIDINRVSAGDVFASRTNPATKIRVILSLIRGVKIETLRADGTGIRPREVAWGTLRENYRKVSP